MSKRKITFKGGTVVLPDRAVKACLSVEDGVVSGLTLAPPAGHEVVDVSGRILLPGFIDPHVHISEPHPNSHRENWYTGSRSAAAGGVTTIVQMPVTSPALTGRESFEMIRALAEAKSCVDFALWGGLIPASVDNMPEMNDLGCVAYKGFMSLTGDFYPQMTDGHLVRAMELAAGLDCLVGLHAENGEAAEFRCRQLAREGCTDYTRYDEARAWWTEAEAVQRAILFAENTGARLYICHLSAHQGIQAVKAARARRMDITAETCPHYLLFTRDEMAKKGAWAKCNPPLRSRENLEALWGYIFDGTLDVLGSDHGIYRDGSALEAGNFWEEPAGFAGIDVAFTAFCAEALARGLPLERMAALLATGTARAFGLGQKGSLLPGMDADIVVLNPQSPWNYDGARSFSGAKSDQGIYQGRQIGCRIENTYVRGVPVYDGAEIVAPAGHGRWVRGGPKADS